MSDPLDNPVDLWPEPPGASSRQPKFRRWVWDAMEPAERRERLRELADWVDWLRVTFELHHQIPPCWYRHPPVREHLTALYMGWLRTYAGERAPDRELAEADWINTLHGFLPRLRLAACATGTHEAPPPLPPPPPGAERALEAYLSTSDAMTAPPHHPAAGAAP